MKKISLFIPALLAVASIALLAAANAPVAKLLPEPKDKGLSQWKAVPKAVQYGKGEGLTEIYDGAYKDYLDAGVVDAVRNLYQRGKDYVEVTVHTFKSPKAAANFFRRETPSIKKKLIVKTYWGAWAVSEGKGYGYSGKYYATVIAIHSGPKADKDAKVFIEAFIRRAALANKAAKR